MDPFIPLPPITEAGVVYATSRKSAREHKLKYVARYRAFADVKGVGECAQGVSIIYIDKPENIHKLVAHWNARVQTHPTTKWRYEAVEPRFT